MKRGASSMKEKRMPSRHVALSRQQRQRLWSVVGALAVLVAITVVAALGYQVFTLDSELQRETTARLASDAESGSLAEDVNALRAQVIAQGERPVAPPATTDPPDTELSDADVRTLALQVVRD